ncbi:MAG: hypothetical protein J6A75_08270 [Lachnospiraceae bacterium]|nr:hypothetical protein [Lachnospiraceae bacterium]
MKERLQRFMLGRYGFDELSKVYLGVTIALMVISMFADSWLLYLFSLGLLVYSYYRAFSKNISKRQSENQKYRNFRYQQMVKWNNFKNRQAQKKIYRFFKCPQCKQRVRVPKGRGKICITCPKCKIEFIKRS